MLTALLLLLVALAYHSAPQNVFHFDDLPNIVDHLPVHMAQWSLQGLWQAATHAFLPSRPVPSMTFAVDWWRGGGSPAAFQWTNLAIHAANALLVFALLAMIGRRSGRDERTAQLAAFFGAAVFAVHPIQVQAVTYIVQRMILLATFFTLACLICYLRARLRPGRRPLWLGLAAACFLLGAASKEIAWITPLLVVLAEFALLRQGPLLRSRLDWLWPALLLAGAVYAIADLAFGGPLARFILPGYAKRDFTLEQRLLTQPRVVLFHLSQFLWPLPGRFSIEHDFPVSTGWWTPWTTLPALLVVAGWLALAWRALVSPRWRLVAFFMLWLPATLAIESSVVPLEMVFEHRMYLPSVGLAGLIALGLPPLLDRAGPAEGRGAAVAGLVLLAGLAYATATRVPVWRTELGIAMQAVQNAPGSARAWSNLGMYQLQTGQLDAAMASLNRSMALDPRAALPWLNRGNVYYSRDQLGEALADYEKAIQLDGNLFLAYNNRGLVHFQRGEYPEALADFNRAIELQPGYGEAYSNRGVVRFQLGDLAAAAEDLDRAIEINPGDAVAHHYLGQIGPMMRARAPQR